MIEKVTDIFGKELQVGDYVAFGDTSSSYNAYIVTGEIISIEHKKVITEVNVKIINSGAYPSWYVGRNKKFIFPRRYSNIIKIS